MIKCLHVFILTIQSCIPLPHVCYFPLLDSRVEYTSHHRRHAPSHKLHFVCKKFDRERGHVWRLWTRWFLLTASTWLLLLETVWWVCEHCSLCIHVSALVSPTWYLTTTIDRCEQQGNGYVLLSSEQPGHFDILAGNLNQIYVFVFWMNLETLMRPSQSLVKKLVWLLTRTSVHIFITREAIRWKAPCMLYLE